MDAKDAFDLRVGYFSYVSDKCSSASAIKNLSKELNIDETVVENIVLFKENQDLVEIERVVKYIWREIRKSGKTPITVEAYMKDVYPELHRLFVDNLDAIIDIIEKKQDSPSTSRTRFNNVKSTKFNNPLEEFGVKLSDMSKHAVDRYFESSEGKTVVKLFETMDDITFSDAVELANKPCPAIIWCGPGHQSKFHCHVKGPHTVHHANVGNEDAEWEGDDEAFGGY